MRTIKAIRNTVYALIISIFTIAIGLIAQRVFINVLGIEYLGLNSLFTSIVSMLALVELGLGAAIYYQLYKPIAEKNTEKVLALLNFYKTGYRVIALIMFGLGLLLIPFLNLLVGEAEINVNIYYIYLLFLIDVVASYLLVYKRALLYADQNDHIISTVHLGYLMILNIIQIAILIIFENYYLYLIVKILMRVVENSVLTLITNRKYPYMKNESANKLDSETKTNIYKMVKAIAYHKVAGYIVLGTDSIIISVFLGLSAVGLSSNYLIVVTAIVTIISKLFTALTASIGNLLVGSKHDKSFDVYGKVRFINFWLACLATTGFLVTMDSFVTIWVGSQYLLPIGVLFAITINMYVAIIRFTLYSFKEAAGIFHVDRHIPFIESIANIVFSITFLQIFGLAGVFLGTACSTLILHLFSYPKYVYKPLFKQPLGPYYRQFTLYFVIAVFVSAITFTVSRAIDIDGDFAQFSFNVALSLIIPNILLFAIFRNTLEFKYYYALGLSGLRKVFKR